MRKTVVLVVGLLALVATGGCAKQSIYWTNAGSGTIERLDANGQQSPLIQGLRSPRGVAIDPVHRYLFYTDPAKLGNDPHGNVERSDLDGKNRIAVYKTNNTFTVEGIAVNSELGKVYFAEVGVGEGPGTIWWANLEEPFDPKKLITEGLVDPRGLAVDLPTKRIFWADSGTGAISSANWEGGDKRVLVSGLTAPHGVAIDSDDRRIYWTDTGSNDIARCDLDRCVPHPLVEGLNHPIAIQLNLTAGHIYWTEMRLGQIMRIDLAGKCTAEPVISNLDEPSGLALYAH